MSNKEMTGQKQINMEKGENCKLFNEIDGSCRFKGLPCPHVAAITGNYSPDECCVCLFDYAGKVTFVCKDAIVHESLHKKRVEIDLEWCYKERAFIEQWQKENEVKTAIGEPILERLLCTGDYIVKGTGEVLELDEMTQRDAFIASTIIQWLGTNIGQAFLQEVSNNCDKYRQQIKQEREEKG